MREGLINREIGAQMQISVSTVKKHLKNALKKRGLQRRRQTLG
jgi:DNA-binding CsgD family transcriptional regulator